MTLEQDFLKILQSTSENHLSISTSYDQALLLKDINKTIWPKTPFRKKELLAYYGEVGQLLLPFLAHQPLIPLAYPNGIESDYFYPHFQPHRLPPYITSVIQNTPACEQEDVQEPALILINNIESLLYLVNQGCINFEISPACCLVWQLDAPKHIPFSRISTIAVILSELLRVRQIKAFIKTHSHKSLFRQIPYGHKIQYGLDVVVPLTPGKTPPTLIHQIFENITHLLLTDIGTDSTLDEVEITTRHGNYCRRFQLGRFKPSLSSPETYELPETLADVAVPYTVLPVEGALVSAPVNMMDLANPDFHPTQLHLGNMNKRLEVVHDLWFDFAEQQQPIDSHFLRKTASP